MKISQYTYFVLGLNCPYPVAYALFIAEVKSTNINSNIITAATSGNLELAEICVSAANFRQNNKAMYEAAENGHIAIVKLLISKGAQAWSISLRRASEQGLLEMVKFLLSYNTPPKRWNYEWALGGAEMGQHSDIVDLLRKKLL